MNPNADPEGYLYGRVVVFTGALMSMTRDTARQACARLGATPEENTTRRAFELQDKGQEIEVMTEDDFLRCLDGNTLDGVEVLLLTEGSTTTTAAVPAARTYGNKAAERNESKPVKPPRALRRVPVPTDQVCSAVGCDSVAAFKTRTKPTWCPTHIAEIQLAGGLRALESFTHPDDWQLTECVACGVEAHYRFAHTLDKNQYSEPTCRA